MLSSALWEGDEKRVIRTRDEKTDPSFYAPNKFTEETPSKNNPPRGAAAQTTHDDEPVGLSDASLKHAG
jgi:hypothetical protein